MNSTKIGIPFFLGSLTLNLSQKYPKTLREKNGYLFGP